MITLGVTSGIACYKAVDLMRDLLRLGARVRVVMTRSAAELVRPALFEALSGERVGIELWTDWPNPSARESDCAKFPHLDFSREIDAFLVAPATANCLGKLSVGIADDLLSTALLAVDPGRTPVVIVPSMNTSMYEHPAVVANRAVLAERGYHLVTPDEGPLACGEFGRGRWPGNDPIAATLERVVVGRGRLSERRVVVTAGRTEVDLDPARTMSNRSTGKMGVAIAAACWREGAEVTLIHGPMTISPPPFIEAIEVRTPAEMGEAVRRVLPGAAQLWMTAAVGDWKPKTVVDRKRKRGEWDGSLDLEPTEDILARAAVEREDGTTLVGFAVETDDIQRRAAEKLAAKRCEFLVVNNPLEEGAGFGHDTNRVFVIDSDGTRCDFERTLKRDLAHQLVDYVIEREGATSPARS